MARHLCALPAISFVFTAPLIIALSDTHVPPRHRAMQGVTTAEGKALADEYRIPFFETSAKKDIAVNEAFQCIAKLVVERLSRDGGGPAKGGAGGAAGGAGKVELKGKKDGGAGGGGCCK
jgi:hypothetical protein